MMSPFQILVSALVVSWQSLAPSDQQATSPSVINAIAALHGMTPAAARSVLPGHAPAK